MSERTSPDRPPGPGTWLLALAIVLAVVEVDPDGVLLPPQHVDRVGWWKRSAEPGSDSGQTLLTGHTVSGGDGVMDRLGTLRPGDPVRVKTSEGTIRYETVRARVLSRAELAENARRLFGQDRKGPRLVLVTCTDWDGDVYRSNIVVFATPLT